MNQRGFAVCKDDGTDWTEEEAKAVINYYEPNSLDDKPVNLDAIQGKWIYDNGHDQEYMYPWTDQEGDHNFDKCTKITYRKVCVLIAIAQPRLHVVLVGSTGFLVGVIGERKAFYEHNTTAAAGYIDRHDMLDEPGIPLYLALNRKVVDGFSWNDTNYGSFMMWYNNNINNLKEEL